MNTVRSAVLVLAVAAAAALAGCTSGPPADSSSPSVSPTSSAPATTGTSSSALIGAWGEDGAGKPSLTIAADGAFNGTDGCNSFAGKGTIDGDTIDFGSFASTLMACPDLDAWLGKADTATASGDTLTVVDKNGSTIGTLDKR